jgi:predicted methyltransferase
MRIKRLRSARTLALAPDTTAASGILLLLLGVAATGCRSADPVAEVPQQTERTAVPDGINDSFLNPETDAEDYVKRWEIESREVYASRDAIVAALQLEPGSRVADIGTGTGLFLAPLAESVGKDGKVFATDISMSFLEHVRNRIRENDWTQVQPILAGMHTTALLQDSIDVAFTCDVYHHFEYHEDMLRSIHSALRPGGRLIVVDFERIPGVTREWLLGHVRAPKETVIQEVTAAGFRLDGEVEIDGFEDNYLLRFTAVPE